jgi:hypothetical protein
LDKKHFIVGNEKRRKERNNLGDIKVEGRIIEIYRKNVAYKFVEQFIGLSMRSSYGTAGVIKVCFA